MEHNSTQKEWGAKDMSTSPPASINNREYKDSNIPTTPVNGTSSNKTFEQYIWITNEGLLRDEGTLFGMAQADIEEKLQAIDDYFNMQKAPFGEKQSLVQQKISQDQKSKTIAFAKLDVLNQNYNAQEYKPHNFFPVAVQLLAYLAVCYFNYSLVQTWLTPVVESAFIPLGVYLFGMSGLFIGRSMLYNHNEKLSSQNGSIEGREKWKIFLEEIGIPAVCSSTIVVMAWQAHSPLTSVFVGLLLFFLFLFIGKGFINLLFQARKELKSFYFNLKVNRNFRRDKRKIKKELDALENQNNVLLHEWEQVKKEMDKLNSELEYRKHLFISEYKLAGKSSEYGVEI